MGSARAIHEVDRGSSVRRYSGAVLLLAAIASSLVACGGGGADGSGGGTNTAILEWDPVTDPNLGGYRIYVGIASGTYVQSLDVGPVTTFTATGLGSGTYYFAVTAYDTNGESAFSNEQSRTFP